MAETSTIPRWHVISTALALLILTACSAAPRLIPAAPESSYQHATIPGYPNIRYWGDEAPKNPEKIAEETKKALKRNPNLKKRIDVLALSGGADDGAYGAGFLKGWSDSGTRPEFTLVTGVSTGAIIAPFAFLGSEYDDDIERFYTQIKSDDIFVLALWDALTGGAALGDSTPLRKIIHHEISEEVVAALAKEHLRGRRLLIGTTNLDAQRQVVWNITKIAASGRPDAAKLIGDIILASASLPGAFPPVMIDVEVDGKHYQELHVDGGVTHEIFVYPPDFNVRAHEKAAGLGTMREKYFWLIRNTKIAPEFERTEKGLTDIASRAMSTLIKYQSRGDLERLMQQAKRDGFFFHLTAVPEDFRLKAQQMFDPDYMKALYKIGYKLGKSGKGWSNEADETPRLGKAVTSPSKPRP